MGVQKGRFFLSPFVSFVEPEIHEKIKKMPSGRKKLVVKRIPVPVDYDIMIRQNKIQVENCSHCWETTKDDQEIDYTEGMSSATFF